MESSLKELVKHYNQENKEDFKLTIKKGWLPSLSEHLSKPLLRWDNERASEFVHPSLWIENLKTFNRLKGLPENFEVSEVSVLMRDLSEMKVKISSLTIN